MKLLLDQGLARRAAVILRASGVDAIHVSEIGMAAASDSAIIQRGVDESRIIVTLDSDFHALLALSGTSRPSIIRLRIEKLLGPEAALTIQKVMKLCAADLNSGAMVTVQSAQIRVRRLPIVP